LTSPAFFEQVKSATGFSGGYAEFGELFVDIFSEIPAMVALHQEVRDRGFPTYILSNTNELTIQYIRRCFPFFSRFDGYVLSYEHQAMKPAPRLYEVAEQLSGWRGSDLFYLDDVPENVEAGRARGWQAWVHQTPERSRAALLAAGVLDHRGDSCV
jgi:FMN phosphatase YigB (HAD superfamily)